MFELEMNVRDGCPNSNLSFDECPNSSRFANKLATTLTTIKENKNSKISKNQNKKPTHPLIKNTYTHNKHPEP